MLLGTNQVKKTTSTRQEYLKSGSLELLYPVEAQFLELGLCCQQELDSFITDFFGILDLEHL
jgi:hypothetical protein